MIKILVVEDDENLNSSVCKHLSSHNYQVKGCLDAMSALDILSAEKYDLIISDIMMPKKTDSSLQSLSASSTRRSPYCL